MSTWLKSLFEGTDSAVLPLVVFVLIFAVCLFGVLRVLKKEEGKLEATPKPPPSEKTNTL